MKITDLDAKYFIKVNHSSWANYITTEGYEISLYGDVIDSYDITDEYVTMLYLSTGGTLEFKTDEDIEGLYLFKVERELIV